MPLLAEGLVTNLGQITTPLYIVTHPGKFNSVIPWFSTEYWRSQPVVYNIFTTRAKQLSSFEDQNCNHKFCRSFITFLSLKRHGVKPPCVHLPLLLLPNKQWKNRQYIQGKNVVIFWRFYFESIHTQTEKTYISSNSVLCTCTLSYMQEAELRKTEQFRSQLFWRHCSRNHSKILSAFCVCCFSYIRQLPPLLCFGSHPMPTSIWSKISHAIKATQAMYCQGSKKER